MSDRLERPRVGARRLVDAPSSSQADGGSGTAATVATGREAWERRGPSGDLLPPPLLSP